MRAMTMRIALLLLLLLGVVIGPGTALPCDDGIPAEVDSRTHSFGTYLSCPAKRILIGNSQYSIVQCNGGRWWGAPAVLQYNFKYSEIAPDEKSIATMSCVAYCEAFAGEGVYTTPIQTTKNININGVLFPFVETTNSISCSNPTHDLFHNGRQVKYNYASCDIRGWYNAVQEPLAENSKLQSFECRQASAYPIPYPKPPRTPRPPKTPRTPRPPNTRRPSASTLCSNIKGISSDQVDSVRTEVAAKILCKPLGNTSRVFMAESKQYSYLRCEDSGLYGMPINQQDSGEPLKIKDANSELRASCVEYCVAQRDEGVKIFQEKMMKKFELTTTTKYGTSYASIQAAEYINQVECYDSTHGLFHNGKQVENNHARCDLRGWHNNMQESFAEIAKPQRFECRPVNGEPFTRSTTPQPIGPPSSTNVRKTTMEPTIPNDVTKTTEEPVAESQSSVVVICASLGAILLLAIIGFAVICVLRSSKNKESENGENAVDAQMEDRRGSEHPEAESDLSEF